MKFTVISDSAGTLRLIPSGAYELSHGEFVGAQNGQRRDLLAHPDRIFLYDGDFYASNGTRLVALQGQGQYALGAGNLSPVYLVNATRSLVDAAGNVVGSVGGGDALPEYSTFADLPAGAAGDRALVLTATGVPFINRKEAGLYRKGASSWDYVGAVPDGYFTDNVLRFFDNADPTKQVALELGGITSGTTRTVTLPDKSGTLAMLDDVAPGPQGPVGPQGPTGATGAAGPEGPQGIQGLQGIQGPAGPTGDAGPQGIQGIQGPAGPTGDTGPQGVQGVQGPAGPANTLSIGTVGTGTAAATITGTAPAQVLNLTLPQGPAGADSTVPGPTGPANSLAIGTVTTGAAGSSAAASITGTAPSQTLNLTIPRGDQGIQGIQGIQGPAGAGGYTAVLIPSNVVYNSATITTAANIEANTNSSDVWTISVPAGHTLIVRAILALTTAAATTGVALGVNATAGTGTVDLKLTSKVSVPVTNAAVATEVARSRRVSTTTASANIGNAILNTASTTDQGADLIAVLVNRGTDAATFRIKVGSEVASSAVTVLADSLIEYALAAI
jgi:hypothetical protein